MSTPDAMSAAQNSSLQNSYLEPADAYRNDAGNMIDLPGHPRQSSPLAISGQQPLNSRFDEHFGGSQAGSTVPDGEPPQMHRSHSTASASAPATPSRSGTLKKKESLRRKTSLHRSSSRRSARPGSVRSLALGDKDQDGGTVASDEFNSALYTPVPTSGSPTDILANRFQAWRKVLKDLINYFRELQTSYESRSKSLMKVSNVINNTSAPSVFLVEGGIGDATHILRTYHKQALAEGQKAKDIENDVIVQLSGLRSDLGQKIKEIKNLSGDFKHSVDKEMGGTRKAISGLQEALSLVDTDPHAISGKGDPYLARLGVDRQVERQIDEENYLHQAFLNLEGSGRELESIIVGEIQKAYNAYAGILKREADEAYDVVERLRSGPIAMAKDYEWSSFVENDPHFVDPKVALRKAENIIYPGQHHPAAAEVRAGMLERKSKYLKSYTPGWYVLSPTHLHEFKSADRVNSQPPVLSLYLPEQKLGSHSQSDSSSHKFMLKGRQTGSMHRGHSWVLRAETHETMLAWYEDIKSLTEKSGEERNAFVRSHARSLSVGSQKAPSVSSEGAMEEDEADAVPYSASASLVNQAVKPETSQRPQPGGRFPSDLQVNRGLQAPLSPSSGSSDPDRDIIAAAGAIPGQRFHSDQDYEHYGFTEDSVGQSGTGPETSHGAYNQEQGYHGYQPYQAYNPEQSYQSDYQSGVHAADQYQAHPAVSSKYNEHVPEKNNQSQESTHGQWVAPVASGIGGAAIGAAGAEAYRQHQNDRGQPKDENINPDETYEHTQSAVGAGAAVLAGGISSSRSSGADGVESSTAGSGVNTLPTTVDNNVEESARETQPASGAFVQIGTSQSEPVVSSKSAEPASNPIAAAEVISGSHTVQPGEGHMHVPGEFPPTPAAF